MTTDKRVTVDQFITAPGTVARTVAKLAGQAFISNEMLGHTFRLTPEQRAAHDAKVAAELDATDSAALQLGAITDPMARKVLELHAPEGRAWPDCHGCDVEGYEAEQPTYPCRTVKLIADLHNITLPNTWRAR